MCDLVKFVDDLKEAILNFRLDLCCFVFSVRAGILLCGYFNVISSMICLIAVSTGVLPPLLMNAQQSFMDGEYVKSTCAFAYSSDICLAVLLLCAMYRKDLVLLRYYTYCGLAMLASTVLVYSMVIGILSVLHTFLLVVSLTYQVYLILLVRSVMVELKHESEKLENYYPNYPIYWKINDIEAANHKPVEAYEMRELVSNKITPEILPATGNLPKRRASEPVYTTVPRTTIPIKDKIEPKTTDPVKNINQPTKSKPVEDTTETKSTEVVNQPTTSKPIKEPSETKITEPVKDDIQPTTSKAIKPDTRETVKDTIQPSTSKTEEIDTKSGSFEKPKALRYPYKFIAIKIPKQETIKEEKENEDKEKEAVKDVTKKEAKEETEEKNKSTKEAKIPKQVTIKEEKENDDKEKETVKDVTKEEAKKETKEPTKEPKKRKRSIFGRKIKNKSGDGATTQDEEKNN